MKRGRLGGAVTTKVGMCGSTVEWHVSGWCRGMNRRLIYANKLSADQKKRMLFAQVLLSELTISYRVLKSWNLHIIHNRLTSRVQPTQEVWM